MKEKNKNYIPLTKKDKVDGKDKITCLNYGTEKCQIHKGFYKVEARLFEALLAQLYAFEEIYTQEDSALNF